MYVCILLFNMNWGLGIGDWGLGIGDWAQSPIPNPQSPIPKKIYINNLYKKYITSYYKVLTNISTYLHVCNQSNY